MGKFISENYAFLFIFAILLFSIFSNLKMERSVRWKFILLAALLLITHVVSVLEAYYATFPTATFARLFLSIMGYILRPWLLYLVLTIILRRESRIKQLMWGIPMVFVTVVLLFGLLFDNIVGYSEDNHFYIGPLYPFTYWILIFYLVIILFFNTRNYTVKEDKVEAICIYIGIGFLIFNIVGERMIPDFGGNNSVAMGLAALVYSVFFKSQMQYYEREMLETMEVRTGLYNEHALISRINAMRGSGEAVRYAVVYFDIVRFAVINEKYGAKIGNITISEYAAQLRHLIGRDEMIARPSSDHFVAFVRKNRLDVFLRQIESIPVKFTVNEQEYEFFLSTYAGVYEVDTDMEEGEEIIFNAYTALNYGKNVTGRTVTYLTHALQEQLRAERQFEIDIPIAMENEEFVVYYQPKVDSALSALVGAEALVRWFHNGVLVFPGDFIPVMERKDKMCELDFYMLRHVCADLSHWIEQGVAPVPVSVNFSRRNLSNKRLAEDIDNVVSSYHVPKKLIEIEITETIDEFPISVLNDFVNNMHRLGYRVAVDDFGSGSSSLSLLREVTFDTLKIDKGFVDRAHEKDLTILGHMIKLASTLHIEVLAEGVEQREQVETLAILGCHVIQGYYYDKPLPKEVFEMRMNQRIYENEEGK